MSSPTAGREALKAATLQAVVHTRHANILPRKVGGRTQELNFSTAHSALYDKNPY